MKTAEFFSGSQSFSRWARSKGFQTWTLDLLDLDGLTTDFVGDYLDFDVTKDLPYMPDVVWASPDCAAFSLAAGNLHFEARKGTMYPKTDKARKSIEVVKKLMSDLQYLLKLNPALLFYIENPVGRMRQLPCMQAGLFQPIPNFRRVTLHQCAYGREYRKATDIFTNDLTCKGLLCPGESCNHVRGKGLLCPGESCNHVRGKDGIQNAADGNIKNVGDSRKASLKSGYWKRAKLEEKMFDEIIFQPCTPN